MSIEALYSLFLKSSGVVIDSRKVINKSLFFAINGERFDGNDFALKALENGADFAIVDRAELSKHKGIILVDNVTQTLQNLATYHRKQFNIPIIGITGSNGKTTTKELISEVLKSHFKTHSTQGNLNNHLGVPLTLLSMSADTEIAIIEMGANHPGEIAFLCAIALPNFGIITNIGAAHLEGFGSLEGVKKTKAELYSAVENSGGLVFINKDEDHLSKLAFNNSRQVLFASCDSFSESENYYEGILRQANPFIKMEILDGNQKVVQITSPLMGSYNYRNILAAVTIGKYFEVPISKIAEGIGAYNPKNNRSQWLELGDNSYLMDAYNANPSSMRAALQSFASIKKEPKVAILGSMLELGPSSDEMHLEILELAMQKGINSIICVGDAFRKAAGKTNTRHFKDTASLKVWFDKQSFKGYTFLLKGSRGIGLEKLI